MKPIWGITHRPKTLDNYIFPNPEYKRDFERMVKEQQIPHLLLSGVQGTGKTTLAHILIDSMNVDRALDVKVINASNRNSVDDIRTEIMDFIYSYPIGDFKIVLLEEADYLSLNAQAVLRVPLEDPDVTARFILTCNYDHKIMPAVKSRCSTYHFKAPSYEDVVLYVGQVLQTEKVKCDLDTIDAYITAAYPDIRKIINNIQANVHNGVLIKANQDKEAGDYKIQLLDILKKGDWEEARMLVCKTVAPGEWEDVYRFLYENIGSIPKFKNKDKHDQGIITIAEHLYKHSICSDSEINAAAMFIKLSVI